MFYYQIFLIKTPWLPPLDAQHIYALDEKPGMVFCLQGQLRRAPYYHGVSRVANRRISLTFRVVRFEEESCVYTSRTSRIGFSC